MGLSGKQDDAAPTGGPPGGVERRRWQRQPHDAAEPPRSLPPVLTPLVFSTRSLPPEEQFAAWRAHMAPLVDVRLPDGTTSSKGFPVDHTAWNLGNLLIVQQRTPAHSYTRNLAKLRTSPIDHWFIAIPRTGRAWTEVGGRVVESEPGKADFRSLGYPFSGRTTESESLIIYLPRDLFADKTAAVDASNHSTLLGNFGDLLINYVNDVETRLGNLADGEPPRVAYMIRDLVQGCLSSPAKRPAAIEQHARGAALMERARRYIQANLNAPELTVDTLAKAVGVSRTRLYSLFEADGGVVHFIWKRRLLAGHAALSNPADGRSISEIAEAAGFTSAASFSRAFKKEFGYSPSAAANSEASAAFGNPVRHVEQEETRSFEHWLKSLGS